MITIRTNDGTVTVHPGPAVLVDSAACPDEPCSIDQGGKCVIVAEGDDVRCLASYPAGVSWIDCVCTESPCEHQQQFAAPEVAPLSEQKQQAKAKALAAAAQLQKKED